MPQQQMARSATPFYRHPNPFGQLLLLVILCRRKETMLDRYDRYPSRRPETPKSRLTVLDQICELSKRTVSRFITLDRVVPRPHAIDQAGMLVVVAVKTQ